MAAWWLWAREIGAGQHGRSHDEPWDVSGFVTGSTVLAKGEDGAAYPSPPREYCGEYSPNVYREQGTTCSQRTKPPAHPTRSCNFGPGRGRSGVEGLSRHRWAGQRENCEEREGISQIIRDKMKEKLTLSWRKLPSTEAGLEHDRRSIVYSYAAAKPPFTPTQTNNTWQ